MQGSRVELQCSFVSLFAQRFDHKVFIRGTRGINNLQHQKFEIDQRKKALDMTCSYVLS